MARYASLKDLALAGVLSEERPVRDVRWLEIVLPLALQAIDNADAFDVLVDACLENGHEWSAHHEPGKVVRSIDGRVIGRAYGSDRVTVVVDGRSFVWPGDEKGPGDMVARALAAALLFGGWSTAPWPLVLQAMIDDWSLVTASGTAFDMIALTMFGLTRHAATATSDLEPDAELRARCRDSHQLRPASPSPAAPPRVPGARDR